MSNNFDDGGPLEFLPSRSLAGEEKRFGKLPFAAEFE